MGQEVARDEVIQAEPSWEAVGWGLHARVRAGELLLGVSSVRILVVKGHISFVFFLVLQRW